MIVLLDENFPLGLLRSLQNDGLSAQHIITLDGFSIGSNDLTQLTLGLDRDSGTVAHLFDERNDAVRWLIARAIAAARRIRKANRDLWTGAIGLSRIRGLAGQ